MTIKQILLTSGLLVSGAGVASAQHVVIDPGHIHVVPPPAIVSMPSHVEGMIHATLGLSALKWEAQAVPVPAPMPPAATGEALRLRTLQGRGSPEQMYSQARNFIDRNQYDRALDPLDKVIAAKAERADGAMYWKAYSLWKLARRDDALSTIGQMQKAYPESRWLRDARALEIEMKQSTGQAVSTDATDDDIKLLAVQGIMNTDPDRAFPVIEKVLTGASSVRLKERALFVISQHRSERAREIMANMARGNANPDLQLRAISYLAQSNTPEAIATLATIYRNDQSMEVRKAVINALISSRNPAAVGSLVMLARAERNADLKMQMVRSLSNSRAPEAKDFMLELLSK